MTRLTLIAGACALVVPLSPLGAQDFSIHSGARAIPVRSHNMVQHGPEVHGADAPTTRACCPCPPPAPTTAPDGTPTPPAAPMPMPM